MTHTGITLAGIAPAGLREADGALVVGAATPLQDLAALPLLGRRVPLLADAARLAIPLYGRSETVGAAALSGLLPGAASPALAAALLALDAELVLAGHEAARAVREALSAPEADAASLLELRVPDPWVRSAGAVERSAEGLVVAAQVSLGEASVARAVRVVTAAPDGAPARACGVERALMGRHPDDLAVTAAAERLGGPPAAVEWVRRVVGLAVERALRG